MRDPIFLWGCDWAGVSLSGSDGRSTIAAATPPFKRDIVALSHKRSHGASLCMLTSERKYLVNVYPVVRVCNFSVTSKVYRQTNSIFMAYQCG